MTDMERYQRMVSRGQIWQACRPSSWPPAELMDVDVCLFYIGMTMADAAEAKRRRDRSRMVTSLSVGGSDMTDEGYYFYGEAVAPDADNPLGELHGAYAILADDIPDGGSDAA